MSWSTLQHRRLTPEWMDQPDIDPQLHRHALGGLARINRWSRSSSILLAPLLELANAQAPTPLRVLDVACGSGDVPIALEQAAVRQGVKLDLCGADLSETALATARERAATSNAKVEFRRLDVLNDPLPTDFDVIQCSLFLHHLTEADAEKFLRAAASAARRAVLVSDLARTNLGYWMAWVGTRLLTRSPVVHMDGPISVEGAFSLDEARSLAARAGLAGARISRRWPQRFLLDWRKPTS